MNRNEVSYVTKILKEGEISTPLPLIFLLETSICQDDSLNSLNKVEKIGVKGVETTIVTFWQRFITIVVATSLLNLFTNSSETLLRTTIIPESIQNRL